MSDYKKQQRANESAFKNRGQVLWTSCVIIEEKVNGRTILRKRMIQGTYHNPDTMAAKRKSGPRQPKKQCARWSGRTAFVQTVSGRSGHGYDPLP